MSKPTHTPPYSDNLARSTDDLAYWVAFSRIPTLGPRQIGRLKGHFGALGKAWSAQEQEFILAGLMPKTVQAIIIQRQHIDPHTELERIRKAGYTALIPGDQDYPPLLKEIPDAPALLYMRGTLPVGRPSLAVVGTRKASHYGVEVARRLTAELVSRGFAIVSGLALGIDSIAHQTTLDQRGTTVAVLGSGLDQIYPRTNYGLSEAIVKSGGTLLSEFPLGMYAQKHHFPIRNRIIAGLSLGTLVIEGGMDSGSLITAKAALEYNREVFAVPGDIFRAASEGANQLIKMGARPVTSADDVVEALNLGSYKPPAQVDNISHIIDNQSHPSLSDEESVILNLITREPRHIDELVKVSKLQTSVVNSTLMTLEVQGFVRDIGGMHYVRLS